MTRTSIVLSCVAILGALASPCQAENRGESSDRQILVAIATVQAQNAALARQLDSLQHTVKGLQHDLEMLQQALPPVGAPKTTTTLRWPFVDAAPGFDTGIAIANTSDTAGACSLTFHGTNAGINPVLEFPSGGGTIAAGTLVAEQVSNIRPNFMGFVTAECSFPNARGYGLFSDQALRNWAAEIDVEVLK
jgi:hypothetical protein